MKINGNLVIHFNFVNFFLLFIRNNLKLITKTWDADDYLVNEYEIICFANCLKC